MSEDTSAKKQDSVKGAGITFAALIAITAVGIYFGNQTPAAVEACENHLLAKLKSPSSYERVDFLDAASRGPRGFVTIDYEAANSFGAMIRGKYWCNMSGDQVTSANEM